MASKLVVFFAIGNRTTLQIRLDSFNGKPLVVWNLDSKINKTLLVKQGELFVLDDWINQIVIPVLADVKRAWLNHIRVYEVNLYKELDVALASRLHSPKHYHPLIQLVELVAMHYGEVWAYDAEQTAAVMQFFATLES